MAQGLRRGHTNTVALLVGDIAQRHFAELTMHVQAALEEIGASLMLFNLGHSATRLARLSRARAEHEAARRRHRPVGHRSGARSRRCSPTCATATSRSCRSDRTSRATALPSIVHEERAAAQRSVAYLLAKGHRAHRVRRTDQGLRGRQRALSRLSRRPARRGPVRRGAGLRPRLPLRGRPRRDRCARASAASRSPRCRAAATRSRWARWPRCATAACASPKTSRSSASATSRWALTCGPR